MISKTLRTTASIVLGIASLSLIAPASLRAQAASSLVTNRLTQPIDDNSRITLKGNVHPLANLANDRGAVPDSMPLDRLQIVLKRSAAQESALQQLIHDQHTPGTASYHKWLTPAQFGQQFGPSDQDVATVESWLASKGFSVEKVDPGKQTLEFSGNAAQFRSAFSAPIHKYMVNGETHYANASDPQIPAALAPVVGGFASLNNFRPHSFAKVMGKATYNPKTGQATPQWTYVTGAQYVLAPGDFDKQYDVPTTLNGSGQTIAIVNDSNINVALVNQFRALFGLPNNPPQVIIEGNDPGVDGINNPDGPNGASLEAYLDVEEAGAVAPNATVDLVIGADTALSSGLLLAAEHAVTGNIAPIISMSFGIGCEASIGTSGDQFANALWEQAAAQGQTVLIATGDSGSAGCDNDNVQNFAVNGASVSGLAATPFNVAVGGTDFFYSSYNQGATAVQNQLNSYWNSSATQNPATSIKGYIPEQPWNNSQYGLNLFDLASASNDEETSIAGGGGGASTINSKPVWQTGTGVPNDKHRDIPDVSLFSATGSNDSFYPVCSSDGDCQPPSGSNLIQITGVGGTSASTPAFAGIMALINQRYGRQGQADYVLYALAAQHPSVFHDVTNGTNSVPCNLSTAVDQNTGAAFPPVDCIAVSNPVTVNDSTFGPTLEGQIGSGTTAEYNTTTGYDLASGLGSVDATQLINYWGSVQFTSTTVSLTSPTAASSFTHGQSVTFSGTVTGTGKTTPSGDVAIETDSSEPTMQGQGFITLSSGSFSSPMTTLPGGTYNVWANYGGDASNASAQSQKTQITVNPESSNIYFAVDDVATGSGAGPAIASGATNIPYGTQLMLSAQVVPSSQFTAFQNCQTSSSTCPTFTMPTGTIAFSDNGSALNTAIINADGDAEYNSAFGVGSHSVTASFNGDASYKASSASAITFTVAKDTPTITPLAITIQSAGFSLPQGQSNAITIQVLNSANLNNEGAFGIGFSVPAAAPTGTVTIGGLPSGVPTSVTLQPSVDPQTLEPAGVATITLPASASGSFTATFTYNGDSNYTTATVSQPITLQSLGGVASSVTASISGSVSPTSTVTISGTVTGKTGDGAPSNTNGGVLVESNGYSAEIGVTPGTGDTSTFSVTFNSQGLLQGTNEITVQFLGDNTYAPSATTLSTTISNPRSDFTMVPDTTIVPVTVGTAATDVVQLAPVNGFSNSVTFTCAAPSGITCSLSPSSYAFSGGSSKTMLTVDASSSAINVPANLMLTGTDSTGKFIHTLAIQVDVSGATAASPDFSINSSPGSLTIAPGATTGNTTGISVAPLGGFTGNVALTAAVTSSPSGATSAPTLTLGPTTLDITGQSAISSILSVASTSSTTTGDYTITVTGTSGGTTHTATLNLTINANPPNFTLASSPGSLTLTAGATTGNTTTINVTPANGFTGSINFTCAVTTSPAGAMDSPTCSAPAATVTGTGSVSSTLTVDSTTRTTGALHRPLDKFLAAGGGAVLAALFFFGIPARRRTWRSILAILVFAGIVGMGIGCGGGSSNNNNNGGGGATGTTAGAYVLTVTGTDAATGNITAKTTVNLTVQ